MTKSRIGIASAAFVIAIIAMMLTSVYAYGMWNFDSKSGAYTTVDVGVAGNFSGGKLYSPAAYVKGIVDKDLPTGSTLKVRYHFEWVDLNHVLHTQDGTVYSSATKVGEWIRVEPSGLPSVVYDIVAEGRAGYGSIWDTDWASASLPWL